MNKLSQFTVVHDLAERELPGYHLVFNTSSAKSLTIKHPDWDAVLAALAAPQSASPETAQTVRRLAELGIVVPAEKDERAAYGEAFDRVRTSPKRIFPILAVTTACNIGCTYCYEAGVTGRTMTPAVIEGIARWVEDRIVLDGIREVYPSLFGGEPLLVPKVLFALMDRINAIAERHGAMCAYAASSNGMKLDPGLAAALAARRLTQFEISLDGPACVHDQRRLGKRGEPSYEQALAGIRNALGAIHSVTVKINFDRHNREAIPELFDDLLAAGLADRVTVKLEAIAYQFADSKVSHAKELVIPPESEEMAAAYNGLTLEARARGIRVTHDTAHTTPCMMSSHHGVIFGPDGDIFKCISLVGRSEFRVGSVLSDAYYDHDEYAKQMNTMKRLDECFAEQCPYVPVCAGGCGYESIVRTGRYDLRFCTKPSLRAYHFQRQLMRHEKALTALGMRPLSAEELRAGR